MPRSRLIGHSLSSSLSKERSTFGIARGLGSSPRDGTAGRRWHRNEEGEDEQDGHDGEREDPLEGDELVQELGDADRGRENTQGETDGVVLLQVSCRLLLSPSVALVLTL